MKNQLINIRTGISQHGLALHRNVPSNVHAHVVTGGHGQICRRGVTRLSRGKRALRAKNWKQEPWQATEHKTFKTPFSITSAKRKSLLRFFSLTASSCRAW